MVVGGTLSREWRQLRRLVEERITEERLGPRWTEGRVEKQESNREKATEYWWSSESLQG